MLLLTEIPHSENIQVVQKHSIGQDLNDKGYDFKDFITDCFPKMTAGIDRRREWQRAWLITYLNINCVDAIVMQQAVGNESG